MCWVNPSAVSTHGLGQSMDWVNAWAGPTMSWVNPWARSTHWLDQPVGSMGWIESDFVPKTAARSKGSVSVIVT